MSNTLFLNTNCPMVGLGTLTYTVPATFNTPSGVIAISNVIFNVRCQVTLPNAVATGDGAGSGNAQPGTPGPTVTSSLSVVVNQNGSPVFTAPTIAAGQQQLEFKCPLLCTAADVITVVFSSSGTADNQLNTIKSNTSIGTGM